MRCGKYFARSFENRIGHFCGGTTRSTRTRARNRRQRSGGEEFSLLRTIGNLGTAAFFTFHYGMFCFVHGVFVVTLFGGRDAFGRAPRMSLDLDP